MTFSEYEMLVQEVVANHDYAQYGEILQQFEEVSPGATVEELKRLAEFLFEKLGVKVDPPDPPQERISFDGEDDDIYDSDGLVEW